MIRKPWILCCLISLFLISCSGEAPRPAAKGKTGSAVALSAEEVLAWLKGDPKRIAVDLRDPLAFANGHLRRSVNLQSGYGQFRVRAVRFFGADAELCLLSDDEAEAEKLARTHAGEFKKLCYLRVKASSLSGGASAKDWVPQKRITAKETESGLRKGEILLLDARTSSEYARGHAKGALFVYPDDFPRQARFFEKGARIVVTCEEGWRSSLLVSWLDRAGFRDARNLIAGMKEWRRLGLPVETAAQQIDFR